MLLLNNLLILFAGFGVSGLRPLVVFDLIGLRIFLSKWRIWSD